jgi:hypothetical protein
MTQRKDRKSAVAPESALQDPQTMTAERSRELSEFADDIASTTPDPALMATSAAAAEH